MQCAEDSSNKCPDCDGQLLYQQYTIRIGNSGPLHVYKCQQCGAKLHFLTVPRTGAVLLANN